MNILHAKEKRHHPAHREMKMSSNPRSVLNCMNPTSIAFKPNLTESGASDSTRPDNVLALLKNQQITHTIGRSLDATSLELRDV